MCLNHLASNNQGAAEGPSFWKPGGSGRPVVLRLWASRNKEKHRTTHHLRTPTSKKQIIWSLKLPQTNKSQEKTVKLASGLHKWKKPKENYTFEDSGLQKNSNGKGNWWFWCLQLPNTRKANNFEASGLPKPRIIKENQSSWSLGPPKNNKYAGNQSFWRLRPPRSKKH